ncbi:hypothetical protein [Kaistella faecalis]|uniref:hypothetical protein n=1 Tax=Kaistella faecalis TaxID=2852098 RepID=UPI001C48C21D|nr:hypothetical protein [Chryseobacterium faecale]UFK98875.1 hypothetical protein LL667_05850 [Chryseobacterium faecale]
MMFTSAILSSQKKKGLDVVSNIDVKVLAMKPLGNNSLAKNLQPFYGFGFGGNLMTPINFGIGLDYSELFSNVKYGERNLYGNIGSPRMTVVDVFLTHRENISDDFMVEEMAGFSYYRLTNLYLDKSEKLKNNAMGFHLGGKAIYTLDGPQQVFAALKANFYYGNVYNENPEIRKYYSNSTFLSLSVGYRYNF